MSWFWIAIASVLSGTLGAMGLGGGGILLLAARELWLGVQAIRRDGWRFRAPEDREKSG